MGFRNIHEQKPTLVLFCGLPGSGKTTTGRAIEKETHAIRLCTDEWLADLGIDLFDEPARDKVQLRLYELAKYLLVRGQNVILEDGLWRQSERDEKLRDAKAIGALVQFHYFDVPFDELLRRLDKRNANGGYGTVPISREQLASYWPLFQRPGDEELSLYDHVIVHRD